VTARSRSSADLPKTNFVANDGPHDGDQLDLSDLSRYSAPSRQTPDQESSAPGDGLSDPIFVPRSRSGGIGSLLASTGARLVLGLLLAGGWWLFTSFDDASRDGDGEIVGGGELGVMTLQVGDCFNDPDELGDVVYDVAAVPCSEPHDNEVFAVGSVGTVFGDTFPGRETLEQYAYDSCVGSFSTYVGVDYSVSSLGVFTFTPSEESWGDGDREYVCALYSFDLTKLDGSAQNSEL